MKNKLYIILIVCFISLAAQRLSAQQASPTALPQDNALIDLSAALVNAVVARDVDQTDKISDVILGNPVTGTARTRGKVSAVLVPDAGNGVVDIIIRGTTVSDTVAVPPEKNLLIYSTTYITFIVRKRIYVNESGIYSFPTQAKARACAKLRKVTNLQGRTDTLFTTIAENAFEDRKEQSERIAVDKAQTQLIQNLDDQLGPQLKNGNAAYAAGVQQIMAMGVPLRSFHFSSTKSQLTLGATLLTPGQNPPMSPAPQLTLPFDLGARVHQTAINETAQAMLGGKTFNVDDLKNLPGTAKMAPMQAQLVQHFMGAMPHDLGVKAMTITFADHDPITVVFADHCLMLTIRIKEISTGKLRLPGLTLRAVYKIENTPGGVELVRQGPVQVAPFYHARIGNRILGAVLQGSLDQVFKARIPVPSFNPPAELSQIGTLVPVHGDAGAGWLTLTWIRQGAKNGSVR